MHVVETRKATPINSKTTSLSIIDGGNHLYENNYAGVWGAKTTVPDSDTHLPYDITLMFWQSTASTRRRGLAGERRVAIEPAPPAPVNQPDWSSWGVDLTAGNTAWNSADTKDKTGRKLPYCNMGGWTANGAEQADDHDARSFDCYWA
jgi:hypothetical protein